MADKDLKKLNAADKILIPDDEYTDYQYFGVNNEDWRLGYRHDDSLPEIDTFVDSSAFEMYQSELGKVEEVGSKVKTEFDSSSSGEQKTFDKQSKPISSQSSHFRSSLLSEDLNSASERLFNGPGGSKQTLLSKLAEAVKRNRDFERKGNTGARPDYNLNLNSNVGQDLGITGRMLPFNNSTFHVSDQIGQVFSQSAKKRIRPETGQQNLKREIGPVQLQAEMVLSHKSIVLNRNFQSSPLGKQVLLLAEALATDDQCVFQILLRRLSGNANILGTFEERTVHYFLEAFKIRLMGIGSLKSSRSQVTSPKVIEQSLQEVQRSVPHWQCLSAFTAHQMIIASEGARKIHVIDLTLWGGDYWTSFLGVLCGKPEALWPTIRFTKLIQRELGESKHVEDTAYQAGKPFLDAATAAGIPLQFNLVQQTVDKVTPAMLNLEAGETVIVVASHYLYTLPDERLLRNFDARRAAVRAIRKLRPDLLIVNESVSDFNGPFFLERVKDAMAFFSSFFESLDVHMSRENASRLVFERLAAQDLTNVVACEGLERIVRSVPPEQWYSLLEEHFVPFPVTQALKQSLHSFVERFSPHHSVSSDNGMLILNWKTRKMAMMSSWRMPR